MGFGGRGRRGQGSSLSTLSIVNNQTHVNSTIVPSTDVSHDLGSATRRWSNVYTGDLHLKNERGDWTIYEEADKLIVKNNLTGEFFNLMLEKLEK
jgi:hypothetical protein